MKVELLRINFVGMKLERHTFLFIYLFIYLFVVLSSETCHNEKSTRDAYSEVYNYVTIRLIMLKTPGNITKMWMQ